MAYLQREQRRETILQAAMKVALDGGFSAMTVRRIAQEAGVATGQVHHHFASSAELKSQAFIALIGQMMEVALAGDIPDWHQRLQAILGSEEHSLEPYIRLWREAQLLVNQDDDIRRAYVLTMEMWHAETVKVLELGKLAGVFRLRDDEARVAWRLIALVCGLDGLEVLGLSQMDSGNWEHHLRRAIESEVGGWR